jgi:Tfp pilus assembly protein PilF
VSFRYSSEQSREAVAATYLEEAHDYIQTHAWEKALDAAKGVIHAKPMVAEAHRIAGLAAGQIYGMRSDESRFYYAKYLELEPDTKKTAFVKEIFPDLIGKQR